MPVYLVTFNVHPADDSQQEAHRAELRARGLRSIIEQRFAPDHCRRIAASSYFVDTEESMVTLTAFTDVSDEIYIVPLAGPAQGRSPVTDAYDWLAERLLADEPQTSAAESLAPPRIAEDSE